MEDKKKFFSSTLLRWNHSVNNRPMPWKGEKDPYKIWLSEIILQQTRVEQGWDYYNRFVTSFPTIQKLAAASETKVFKLWEGLGYYSRCKNLIATAQIIVKEYKSKFPDQYEQLLKLKGVGTYTAAAIASFAFNLPYAVVDGNVFRVLSRYFGNSTPIDSNEGKKLFTQLAETLLDKKQPGIYNQALMDFGAVVCKPKLALCTSCPLKSKCVAYENQTVDQLPVKEKKIIKTTRWFYYIIAEFDGKLLVRKRTAGDIWENLYEFILEEKSEPVDFDQIKKLRSVKQISGKSKIIIDLVSKLYEQKLTHQTIYGQFITIKLANQPVMDGYKLVSKKQLNSLPFPKFIAGYLKDKNVSLNLI
ncbi:MAG: A/G-specific adenine glycosylase [Ferruginibacter sp.]